MRAQLVTAGERLTVETDLGWVARLLAEGAAGRLTPAAGCASLAVHVERDRGPLWDASWQRIARDAWARPDELVVENVLGAGFDLHLGVSEVPLFTYRWRPSRAALLAARALPSRFHLLARAALLQYPALWVAGLHGRVPLHASCFTAGGSVPLLAGPGGIGKSTLLAAELAGGGVAACDNLGVSDGTACWGVVEPLRVEGVRGRRMPHGRREASWQPVEALAPDRVLVLARGEGDFPELRPISREAALRSLVAGTYMAGELRRYWGFAATLALGTGLGPVTPDVTTNAWRLVGRLPCAEVRLARTPGHRLAELLNSVEATA